MEFRDLKTQYESMKDEMQIALNKVLDAGNYIMGQEVRELETKLAHYVGKKYCITCANGTDALQLALMAWDIKEGDAVFVPDFTFFSSAEVVSLVGATPVFVDVYKETFNISIESLEEQIDRVVSEGKLTPKVIVAVDLFGQVADYARLRTIADKYNMYILEDAAQGFGGVLNGVRACNFGDISTTSFFPAKPLGCYGDGGAIFTDNPEWNEVLCSLRIHGKGKSKYDNIRIGLNSRLDTLQAAILNVKFDKFVEYELDKVDECAKYYTEKLENWVETPKVIEGGISSWAQYSILLNSQEERDGLQAFLKENDIPSMIYYEKPLHNQLAFAHIPYENKWYENTIMLCQRVLSLPMHPYLSEADMDKVVGCIVCYLEKVRKI